MQVSFDTPPGVIGGRDDPCPRGGQLRTCLNVRDRNRDEVGEVADALLCAEVERRRIAKNPRRLLPTPAVDHDRGSDSRATNPSARMRAAAAPAAWSWLSIRAARPHRRTIAATFSPSSEKRSPTGIFCNPGSSAAASKRAVPSGSYRNNDAFWTSRQLANSATTVENTSDGGTPRATNVATRRSAVCCRAARSASCRRRRLRSRLLGPAPRDCWTTAPRRKRRQSPPSSAAGSAEAVRPASANVERDGAHQCGDRR